MKYRDEKSVGSSNNKSKQTQIHIVALIASFTVLVFGLITAPYMIYAQNVTSTQSNATTVESHPTNTTGTPLNATVTVPPKPPNG
jgi:hypothetical protein